MLQATRNFIRRNRTNLAVGLGLVGAGYIAAQYIGSKLSDAKTRMMSDRVARENLQRRFEQNQEDCSFTVQALLPTASEYILKELPVERLTQELQQKKAARLAGSSVTSTDGSSDVSTPVASAKEDDTQSLRSFASESFAGAREGEDKPRKSKAQLWNEIKISSLTRSFTLLYTLSLLTLLTRVQLNLLGRKNYLSSVVSLAERDGEPTIRLEYHEETPVTGYGIDLNTNRQYLTFSWWLLHRGWRVVMEKVDAAVKQVFGPLTPRDNMSLGQFRELAEKVRKLIQSPPNEPGTAIASWLPYLLPPRDEEAGVLAECGDGSFNNTQVPSEELRKLLDETSDLIDSPMAAGIVAHMVDVGFAHMIDDKLVKLVFQPKTATAVTEGSNALDTEQLQNSSTTKLASILAVVARQAHLIGNGTTNEYLEAMERKTELQAFSALVYSSNFEYVAQNQQVKQ